MIMKKLFLGIALITATTLISNPSYAVPDEKVLEVIQQMKNDNKALCAKLKTLPEEDKERLHNLYGGEAVGEAQKKIQAFLHDDLMLGSCVQPKAPISDNW